MIRYEVDFPIDPDDLTFQGVDLASKLLGVAKVMQALLFKLVGGGGERASRFVVGTPADSPIKHPADDAGSDDQARSSPNFTADVGLH